MANVFTVHTADNQNRFLGSAFLWGRARSLVTNAHGGNATEVRLTDAAAGAEQIAQGRRGPHRDVT